LYSPNISLPSIGAEETMHFGFYLHADIPDSDGDNDGNLDDYYRISINDISATAWHSDDIHSGDGNNFWCGDEDVNGYLDGWIQYLDTPSISVGNERGQEVAPGLYIYVVETPTGEKKIDKFAVVR
jgi:hypothetical protein